MNGWVIYDLSGYKKNKWFADRLVDEASKFSDTGLVLVEDLRFGIKDGQHVFEVGGKQVEAPDFAVCRTTFPVLSLALERAGTRVYNDSETSRICNDKRLTYSYVCSPEIPTAGTYFYSKNFDDGKGRTSPDYPVILKSASGHGGEEVFYIDSEEEHKNKLSKLCREGYVEQSVCTPYGKDVRVYVLGTKIVAAVLRSSETFKSNYSLGGTASVYELGSEEKQLVKRVIEMIPAEPDFVGVDFLLCDGCLIFNEIEDVAGTRMLYDVTDLDAAKMYMEYIESTVKGRKK